MIKLMYITNDVQVAKIVDKAGVERVFVDMEYIGKGERQGGKDTVQNHHTVEDVRKIKNCLVKAELLVRCNPIHDKANSSCSSKKEIDDIIGAGADIIMLPFFKTLREVKSFIDYVGGRAKTMLLVETPEAVEIIDEILNVNGVDEIFIGLNDLSIGYGKKFMFELLVDGTVEFLCEKFKKKGLPYGFGGVAALGKGMLPADYIIPEHYRLGSTMAILSRSFCNTSVIKDIFEIQRVFDTDLKGIREYEKACEKHTVDFIKNKEKLCEELDKITKQRC